MDYKDLGNAIGNSIEVMEAIDVLKGNGPSDLRKICVNLSSEMLSLVFGGEWKEKVINSLDSGSALSKFYEWIEAQGGNLDLLNCRSKYSYDIIAKKSGYITHMNSELIGRSAMLLGAGRTKVTDTIDYSSGIILRRKNGDYLSEGDVIATLFTNNESSLKNAEMQFCNAVEISDMPCSKNPLIYDIIK